MGLKGAVKTVESSIAVLIILGFLLYVFTPFEYDFSDVRKSFVEETLKELLSSGYLDEAIESENVTTIKEKISEIVPYDFEVGLESLNVTTVVTNETQRTIYLTIDKDEINSSYIDIFTPEKQKIEIRINSQLVFSLNTSRYFGIDIYNYLTSGVNEIKISKTGTKEVYVFIFTCSEILPQINSTEVTVISFPYYTEKVRKLYVFM